MTRESCSEPTGTAFVPHPSEGLHFGYQSHCASVHLPKALRKLCIVQYIKVKLEVSLVLPDAAAAPQVPYEIAQSGGQNLPGGRVRSRSQQCNLDHAGDLAMLVN